MRVTRLLMSIGMGCLAAIVLARASASQAPQPSPEVSHYGFEWSITQEPGVDKVFRCVLRVRDLDTGAVISNPTLLSKWGERAEIAQVGADLNLAAAVFIDEQGRRATFEAKLVSGGRPIAEHQASVGM